MPEKFKSFFKRCRDLILYGIFGVLTTAVNYLVYLPLYNLTELPAAVSNAAAWLISVIFAFWTNKAFVFHSRDWSAGVVLPELWKFVGCRILSGILETAVILLTVDILQWNGNIWKLIVSGAVIILNYFASKLLIFKNK